MSKKKQAALQAAQVASVLALLNIEAGEEAEGEEEEGEEEDDAATWPYGSRVRLAIREEPSTEMAGPSEPSREAEE
jgi:hypothetical protein